MQIVELTGQVETHLASLNEKHKAHKAVITPFLSLQEAANKAGFNLQIASGFRSFERQRMIWNNKYSGSTPLLDKDESIITNESMTDEQKLFTILHWSALPGASRHHWGTDFDIYDPDLLPKDTKLQLVNNEYQVGGCFFELSQWLSQNMKKFGFYRPYHHYQGGVAAEPWHISYQPVADECLQQLTLTCIHDLIIENNILGKSLICKHLPMIYKQYICNINCNGK